MDFYWMAMIFLGYLPIHYFFFHMNLRSALRARKYSKSFIDKSLKGRRNFWFYEELNRKIGLGPLYWFHKSYVCLYPGVFAFHLLLGWVKPLQIISAVATGIVLILAGVSWAATWYVPDRDGKKGMVTETSAVALYGAGFPLYVCCAVIKYIVTTFL